MAKEDIAKGPVGAKMIEMLRTPSFARGLSPSILFDLAKSTITSSSIFFVVAIIKSSIIFTFFSLFVRWRRRGIPPAFNKTFPGNLDEFILASIVEIILI